MRAAPKPTSEVQAWDRRRGTDGHDASTTGWQVLATDWPTTVLNGLGHLGLIAEAVKDHRHQALDLLGGNCGVRAYRAHQLGDVGAEDIFTDYPSLFGPIDDQVEGSIDQLTRV